MEAASTAAEADAIGNHTYQPRELIENSTMERNTMLQKISILVAPKCQNFVRFAVSVLFALSLGCSSAPMLAQEPGQRTFASAEDASRALFDAMHAQDEQSPLSILGPGGKDVISSGDRVDSDN